VRLGEAVAPERLDLGGEVVDDAASFLPTALRSTSASASEKPARTLAIRITCSW
jgi:hypothetical protein